MQKKGNGGFRLDTSSHLGFDPKRAISFRHFAGQNPTKQDRVRRVQCFIANLQSVCQIKVKNKDLKLAKTIDIDLIVIVNYFKLHADEVSNRALGGGGTSGSNSLGRLRRTTVLNLTKVLGRAILPRISPHHALNN